MEWDRIQICVVLYHGAVMQCTVMMERLGHVVQLRTKTAASLDVRKFKFPAL